MTEERFVPDAQGFVYDIEIMGYVPDIFKLLNELAEENQEYENEITRLQLINSKLKDKDYTNYKKKIQELQEKNKRLKGKIQQLTDLILHMGYTIKNENGIITLEWKQ